MGIIGLPRREGGEKRTKADGGGRGLPILPYTPFLSLSTCRGQSRQDNWSTHLRLPQPAPNNQLSSLCQCLFEADQYFCSS